MNPDLWIHLVLLADRHGIDLTVVRGPGPCIEGRAVFDEWRAVVWNWQDDEDSYLIGLHELGHLILEEDDEDRVWEWTFKRAIIPKPLDFRVLNSLERSELLSAAQT